MTTASLVDRCARMVKEAIAASGMTVAAVAEVSGMSYPTLTRKLGGRSALTVGELLLIAEAIGVPPSRLLPAVSVDVPR